MKTELSSINGITVVVTLFLSLFIFVAENQNVFAAEWYLEDLVITHAFSGLGPRHMALNSEGTPHVAYGSDYLYFASAHPDGWNVQIIDDNPWVGHNACLVIDDLDIPHICYLDRFMKCLKYATKTHSGWEISSLPPPTETYLPFAMALDSSNKPVIAYYSSATNQVSLVRKTGSTWTIQGLATLADDFNGIRLVMDGDNARIVYTTYSSSKSEVTLGIQDGAAWQYLVIDSTGRFGDSIDMVIDSLRDIHIGYHDSDTSSLKYVQYNLTTGPTIPVIVDNNGNSGFGPSIAINHTGQPAIAYFNSTAGQIYYSVKSGTTWTPHVVPLSGSPGSHISMDWDTSAYPRFSYVDDVSLELKYAFYNSATWISETIDQYGSVAGTSCLALDSSTTPWISYYNNFAQALEMIHWTGEDWVTQTLYQGELGMSFDMIMDTMGDLHFSFGEFDEGLFYGKYSREGFEVVSVDTQSQAGEKSRIVIDSNGTIHILYTDPDNGTLKIARQDGVGWITETIANDQASWIDLAIDQADRLRVSFQHSEKKLMYAWKVNTEWLTTTVDSGMETGYFARMALDINGKASFAYYDQLNGRLVYAESDGSSGYTLSTIGYESVMDMSISVCRDINDNPVVTFSSIDSMSFSVAHRENGIWQIEELDSGPAMIFGVDLEMNNLGRMLASYTDYLNGDLRLAFYTEPTWYNLTLSRQWYHPGDTFSLYRSVFNTTSIDYIFDEYLFLDVYDEYWFYPTWTQTPAPMSLALPGDDDINEQILEFTWPTNTGTASGIRFWGGILEGGTSNLMDYDMIEFGWND